MSEPLAGKSGAGDTTHKCPAKRGSTLAIILKVIEQLESGQYRCKLVKNCKYTQANLNATNFKRHMKKVHPVEYNKDLPFEDKVPPAAACLGPNKEDRVVTYMTKTTFLSALVKLVTVHGLPFKSMIWEGMQELIKPYCEAFDLMINNQNIRDYVALTATAINNILREELKGKVFSLKIDAASKMFRSILGINCQYIDDKGMQHKRTLAMVELTDRHTGSYLKSVVCETLAKFDTTFAQIHAVTIDNGKNIVKMTDLMSLDSVDFDSFFESDAKAVADSTFVDGNDHDEEEKEEGHDDTVEREPEEDADFSRTATEDDDQEQQDEALESALDDLERVVGGHAIVGVRCGAHTLQLVVADATKQHKTILKSLTKIVNSLRNAKYKTFFEMAGLRYPPTPVPTRWNSCFTMLRCVLDQRDKFVRLGQQFPELSFDEKWSFIADYVNAFEPLYDATIAIQREKCSLGDFFGQWLTVTGKVELMEANVFREEILVSMKSREKTLLNNYAVQAALYVDPRFSFNGSMLFSKLQKENIIEYLLQVSKKVEKVQLAAGLQTKTSTTQSEPAETSVSTGFSLNSYVSTRLGPGTSKPSPEVSLEMRLRAIQYQPKEDADQRSFCVVEYWSKKRWEDPQVWAIIQVVLSAAATQCTVERDFNQFNLVYTKNRNRMSSTNLENVLMIRNNRQLVGEALSSALSAEL